MKHVSSRTTKTIISDIDQASIQPNAVDLRLDKVFQIYGNTFVLSEEEKVHRSTREIQPDEDGWFFLNEGNYQIVMKNTIEVGDGEAGRVVPRSTLIRNGLDIGTGLYDSGYAGSMAALLKVTCGPAKIKKNTRIGQYLCEDAEMLHKYNGSYQNK